MSNINDLWHKYLRGEGYSGQVNDMMYQWLGDKGYTGNINDRWMAALKAGDVFGTADPISILGSKLAAWLTSDPSTLFTTSTGETPVTAAGEPVGLRVNRVSGGPNAIQTTETARPLWQTGPNRIVYDPDDALTITLPAISGGQIVISSPVGIWIDSLDFAGGTFSLGPTTYTGGHAGLWSILGNAEMQVCILDDAMTNEEQTALVAYLVAQGSPGLITLGPEIVDDPEFDNPASWTTFTAGSSSAGLSGSALNLTVVSGGMAGAHSDAEIYAGKKYLAVVSASSVGGALRFCVGVGNLLPTGSTAFGITAAGTTGGILSIPTTPIAQGFGICRLATSGNYTASIDALSLREVILP